MSAASLPISRTKIIAPTLRPEILSRERLLTRLDELLDQKLILITAPAGYGKTSLLIDLAQHSEMPVCWLSLDPLDRDPQRFISYLIAAISQRFPRFGNQSISALNNLTTLDQGLENLIVTLVNEIYEKISEHFVLVLDDYQFVDGIPEIRDFVSRFIQLASENCHLILSSRRLPALPDMAILVARQQVGGFDLQVLAFQPGEIRALFENIYGIHLTDGTLEDLFQRTEGWVTGLNLFRLEVSDNRPDQKRIFHAMNIGLPEYLDQQVLSKQPPVIREFLLQTSLFDEFDAELCSVVLGALSQGTSKHWNKLLETVKRENLFVLPVGPNGKWLRYHHLVQEFLQSRLKEESPETAEAILVYLAQYHEQRGEWEKAHHIYQQLGDFAALAGLVERAGTHLIQSDRIITLGSWLDELPEVIVQEHAGLLSLKGFVELMRGKLRYGLSLLDQSLVLFRSSRDLKGLALTLIYRAWANRLLGDYTASLADADEALQISMRSDDLDLKGIRAETQRNKGLCLYRLGQAKEAILWLERSLSLFTELDEFLSMTKVQMELGMARRATGNYEAARTLEEKALEVWKKRGDLIWQANLLNSLGVIHHMQGEYEQAAISFEQGLDCARRSGYLHTEALLLTSLGDLYTELSEYEIARHAYEKAEDIARQTADRFLLTYSLLSQAGIARASQAYDRARLLLDEVRLPVKDSNSSYEQGLYELEYGRLELSAGNAQRAIPHLESAAKSFNSGSLALETSWSRLWLAAACNHLGDKHSACSYIKETVRLDGKVAHSISMVAFQVRAWLGDGLSEDAEAWAALVRLLSQAEKIQSKLPALRKRLRRLTSTVPMPPPHLDIRGFGKAQVRVNGKLVTNADWQARSVCELFFYFLHASEPMTKEQIGADLWPEITPSQLKLRFKNNIYRLRRALGPEIILWERDIYKLNRDLDYEYDIEAFRSHLGKARVAKGILERIKHYQAAIELVRGPYLNDIDATWAVPEREQLQQEYLRALLSLTRLYLQTEKNEEALQTCLRSLALDGCLEEAHRFAMRIYDRLGDKTAVIRQYRTCRDTLRAELAIEPSPETKALYRQLTS
jgi:LuxR family maltose regulon positive regulatory protein